MANIHPRVILQFNVIVPGGEYRSKGVTLCHTVNLETQAYKGSAFSVCNFESFLDIKFQPADMGREERTCVGAFYGLGLKLVPSFPLSKSGLYIIQEVFLKGREYLSSF